jgi:hypothetical protein
MPIGPGTTLGAYEVQDLLGQGAMGTVYRAHHAGLARTAAVKVLAALTPDPDSVVRFGREAQPIARMRHPNVLNVYDFGEHEGTPYMIVEYFPGGSLGDRLRSGKRYGREQSLELLEGIAAALDYAHGLDVIHRDVRPSNVLLDARGGPILADFGLAKVLRQSSVTTVSGVTTGTPAYMSPEQVMGAPIGPATDTYALATMAYELLTGVTPFEGEGVLELLYAHVHRVPPAASSREGSLGPAVDAVLARGLAKDPGRRWDSSAALVEALRDALTPAPAPAADATLPVEVAAAPALPPPGRRRGRLLPVAIGGALLLALVAGALFLLYHARHGAPRISAIPATVRRGGSFRLDAGGFASGKAFVQVGTPGGAAAVVAAGVATGSGSWSTTITVPVALSLGPHGVRACNAPAPGTGCATTSIDVTRGG